MLQLGAMQYCKRPLAALWTQAEHFATQLRVAEGLEEDEAQKAPERMEGWKTFCRARH